MTQFICHGPYAVPTKKLNAGRVITNSEIKSFWDQYSEIAALKGCYVFGMRAGRGVTPLYVGKATRSFKQEVFTPHKLKNYLMALATYRVGTPILFFVVYPPGRRGVVNERHIGELERFLIQQAFLANPRLMNIKHAAVPNWGIVGVLRSENNGAPPKSARAFKAMLRYA